MSWLPSLKDYWWLYGVIVAVFSAMIRAVIKAHHLKEQIDTVQKHSEQIKGINAKMDSIEQDSAETKQGITELKESLQEHREENRRDIMAIMDAVLSLVDGLKKQNTDNPDFDAAHKKIRKRQLER